MAEIEKGPQIDKLEGSGSASLASDYGIDEKKLLRKLDYKLLPAVSVLYLLSFLDRSNVANARVEGLTTDLNMTGNQYLTGLTLFFVGYILFEVPWNLTLRRMSPKIYLPTITLIWGVVATLMGLCSNLTGFFIVRFFLGVAEGGLFPGVVFYLSMWYKRNERQFRIALFFSAASLAGAFGGILAYGIAFMNNVGGLHGWRWIFIIEGLLTIVVALSAYYYVSGWPAHSNFLSKNEKEFVVRRIEADKDKTATDEEFQWNDVSAALKDYKCWLYCAAYHTMSLPLYTLSLFLPTIIRSLGYTAAQAQLLTVPPYVVATVLTAVIATISERKQIRAPFIIGAAVCAIIGYAILLGNHGTVTLVNATTHVKTVNYARPGVSYVGTFFAAAGIYPACALVLSWPAVNVSGATKRATAGAMQITIGNLGAVIGTQIYRTNNSPTYKVGHAVAMAYLAGNILVSGSSWYLLGRENKKRDAIVAAGRTVDTSDGDENLHWRFKP